MTGIEIAQTALSNLNTYEYLFGAKGEVMTSAGIENLIAMYPGYFSTDAKKVAARAKAGKACLDCSGFVTICSDMPVMGSWQLREFAAERRTLEQTDGVWKAGGRYIPVGAILWKAGHVGIYVGNQKVAEAQSEELNLNLNPVDGRGFTECLLFSSVNYDENTSDLQVQASAPSSSEYIPWIGKVVNTVSVMPVTSPSANGAASPIGMLENGALVRVMSLSGNYYCIRSSSGFYGYVNTYFIGSTTAPAFDNHYAEWTGHVEGADNHVNLRVAPSVSASLHSTYPQLVNGTEVLVYSEVLGNDDLRLWYAVEITSGVTGYVRADLVKPSVYVSYSAWIGKAASTTGTVNIRTAPTVNSSLSSLHAPLSNGNTVTVIGETLGSDGYRWYTVSLNGIRVGYCRSDLIIPDYDDYYETWEAVILASTGSANVRTGPGTSYSIVTGSPYTNGTIIQVIGEVTGSDGYVWYHITVGNMYYGYIRSDLAEPSLSYIPRKVIANPPTANLNIRNGAGTNYALSGTVSSVPKGKEMTVTGQTCGTDLNIWYKVYVDGVYGGYVRSDLVTPVMTKAYTEWTGEANSTTGTVNVRSEASTNSAVISGYPQMTNGDTCVVYGQVEGADGRIWYRVRILGQYFGYVRSDLISHQITSPSRLGYAKWNGILQGSSQNVNIRYDAGTGYAITAALPNGTAVEVINTKNGTDGYVWYQVRTAEASGYARSDLVLHAGDTIGDNPYTILPWSGRCKTERQQFVYDAPFISLEGATVVKENSFFIILRKVFDRNGESWYHMRSEDGLTDGNGLLLVCYTKVNDVYTFPKAVDCDDDVNDLDGHSYIYPESDILQVCEKCGRHIIYKKPSKTFAPSNVMTTMNDVDNLPELNDNTSSSYQNRVIDYPLFLQILQDIETGYYNYYTNVLLPIYIYQKGSIKIIIKA